MTKKLVWRLSKLPTVEEISLLLKDKIITQEDAKEILFSSENEDDRDKKSLESEIKFLRELVEKLSSNYSKTVEIIKEVKTPYYYQHWYKPYETWCVNLCNNNISSDLVLRNGTSVSTLQCDFKGGVSNVVTTCCSFTDIKTF